MQKNLILISVFVLFIFIGILFLVYIFSQKYASISAKINNLELEVQLADNFAKKIQGLSGREQISNNEGILFIFKKPGYYPFWMKGMKFPIDIIWLDKDLKVINVNKEVKPESFPETFQSTEPARYVLEINAGLSDKYGIKEGDKCFLNNLPKTKQKIWNNF